MVACYLHFVSPYFRVGYLIQAEPKKLLLGFSRGSFFQKMLLIHDGNDSNLGVTFLFAFGVSEFLFCFAYGFLTRVDDRVIKAEFATFGVCSGVVETGPTFSFTALKAMDALLCLTLQPFKKWLTFLFLT